MRPLAIARFRLWTTIRSATPFVTFAAAPPIVALLVNTFFALSPLMMSPDLMLRIGATAAMASWLFHAFLMVGLAHQFGQRPVTLNAPVPPGDLIDSAPISPAHRSTGEFTGIFTSALLIHVACLPLLAVVAALSPLPSVFFACFEGLILSALILASASAAWRMAVLGHSRSGMRAARNAGLFILLALIITIGTTRPVAFRDGAFQFVIAPSMAAWSRLLATIEYPVAMVTMLLTLYGAYLAFFGLSAFGKSAQE
jgi:hypothetical protein